MRNYMDFIQTDTEDGGTDYLYLLSSDEAHTAFPGENWRNVGSSWCWWLRDPGRSDLDALYINSSGSICYDGQNVRREIGVLPALNLKAFDLHVGDLVRFGANIWKVLKVSDDDIATLISDSGVWRLQFDDKSNDYENSIVRKWLNSVLLHELFSEEEIRQIVPKKID